jgi:hypothetical protein
LHIIEGAAASQAGAPLVSHCTKTVPNVVGFWRLGLALSEKQIPQVVVNVANSKHRIERMEWLNVLAKQVLSQLSYTPIEIGLLECCNFFILRCLTHNCN